MLTNFNGTPKENQGNRSLQSVQGNSQENSPAHLFSSAPTLEEWVQEHHLLANWTENWEQLKQWQREHGNDPSQLPRNYNGEDA
ncbi:MAG: hypothetical protein ACFBSC_00960 [Microcoleaceae cyanobacterium]